MKKRFVDALHKWYYSLSIRWKMNISFIFTMALLLVAIIMVVYKVSSSILIREAIGNTTQNISLISDNLDRILSEVETYTSSVITNSVIQEVLSRSENDDSPASYTNYSDSRRITGALDGTLATRALIESFIILSLNGEMFDSGKIQGLTPINIDNYKDFWEMKVPYRQAWEDTHKSNYQIKQERQNVITYAKCFYNAVTGEPLGVIQANVNERVISSVYENVGLGDTGRIFMLNSGGMVVSSLDKPHIYMEDDGDWYLSLMEGDEGGRLFKQENGREHLMVYSRYGRLDWIIVGIVPTEELIKENDQLVRLTVMVLLASFVLLTVAVWAISRSITKPIINLKEAIEDVADGDLETRAEVIYNDEVGSLATSFNTMVKRTSQLMDSFVAEQQAKRNFELSLLQSQINPHFLYNTLENICGLAELGRTEDTIYLVNELAMFYRGVLSGGSMVVTIEEELSITKKYLNIVKLSCDALEYKIDVDKEILHYPTIKLLLQPLVENAVQHGIKYKDGVGHIDIKGRMEEDSIVLSVHDNGIGIPREQLGNVFDMTSRCYRSKSFGLKSADERIKMYFGERSGLTLESEYGQGTTVCIAFPKCALWGDSSD